MLHREPDENGNIDWRQLSGLNEHGEYHHEITIEECGNIARQIKEFENAILTQEISFLEFIEDYFTRHNLRHVQKVYDNQMRRFSKGEPVKIMVYCAGELEGHQLIKPG